MPTFKLRCNNDCGNEIDTPIMTRFSEVERISAEEPCENCGGKMINVPLGGSGFQLKNVKGDMSKTGSGNWSSRGRCYGKEL